MPNFFFLILQIFLIRTIFANILYVRNNGTNSENDGYSKESALNGLSQGFEKISPSIQSLFLIGSDEKFTISIQILINYDLVIQAESENITIAMNKNVKMEINASVIFKKLKFEIDCDINSLVIFFLLPSSNIIFQDSSISELNDCLNIVQLLKGVKAGVFFNSSSLSNFNISNIKNGLIKLDGKSILIIQNSTFTNIYLRCSNFLSIYGDDSLIEIQHSSFTKMNINQDSFNYNEGSFISSTANNIKIFDSIFSQINFGISCMISTPNSVHAILIIIHTSIFKKNTGFDKGLIVQGFDKKINLSIKDLYCFENNIYEKFPAEPTGLFFFAQYFQELLSEVHISIQNFTSIGNFGPIIYTDFAKSISLNGVYIYNNGWRDSEIIPTNGKFSLFFKDTENASVDNLHIINALGAIDIGGFFFHVYFLSFYNVHFNNLKKRIEKGETVFYNFTNCIFSNISSVNTNPWQQGSALHFVLEAPVFAKFDNILFLNNKNDLGRPCMDIWCYHLASLNFINLKAELNSAYSEGVCFGINKAKLVKFINSTFANNYPTYFSRNNSETVNLGRAVGVIKIDSSSFFAINCTFANNSGFQGGSINVKNFEKDQMVIQISNCLFENNFAQIAGVLSITNNFFSLNLIVEKCIFNRNLAFANGGVFFFDFSNEYSNILIESNRFFENGGNKGEIFYFRQEKFETFVSRNIFCSNYAQNQPAFGGAFASIYYFSDDVSSIISAFSNYYLNNTSQNKGGVALVGKGEFHESYSQFIDNKAEESGGSILIQNMATVYFNNCFIEKGGAGLGGFLKISENSKLTFNNSFIISCFAVHKGGSFLIEDHLFTQISNSIIFGGYSKEGACFFIDASINPIVFTNVSILNIRSEGNIFQISSSKNIILNKLIVNNTQTRFLKALALHNFSLEDSKFINLSNYNQVSGSILYAEDVEIVMDKSIFKNLNFSQSPSAFYFENSNNITFGNILMNNVFGESFNSIIICNLCSIFIFKSLFYTFGPTVLNLIHCASVTNLTVFQMIFTTENKNKSKEVYSLAIIQKAHNSTFINCSFLGSEESFSGGGINFLQGSKESNINLIHNFFYKNKAKTYGGAIRVLDQQIFLNGCIFYFNSADQGGAIAYLTDISYQDSSSFINNFFFSNVAFQQGGVFYFKNKIPYESNNAFKDNTSPFGEIYSGFPYKLRIKVTYNKNMTTLNQSTLVFDSSRRNSLDPIILPIASGQLSDLIIIVDILDKYDQRIVSINEGYGKLNPLASDSIPETKYLNSNLNNSSFYLLNKTDFLLVGGTESPNLLGSTIFSDLTFFGTPSTYLPLHITNTFLDEEHSNFSLLDSSHRVINGQLGALLIFKLRECDSGEFYQNKTNICYPCPTGKFSFFPFSSCQSCPKNSKCPGRSEIILDPGYWRSSLTSLSIYTCKQSCLGGLNSSCREGYEGPICALCSKKPENGIIYTKIGGKCEQCLDKGLTVFIGCLLMGVGVGLGLMLSFWGGRSLIEEKKGNDKSKRTSILAMILVNVEGFWGGKKGIFIKQLVEHLIFLAISQNFQEEREGFRVEWQNVQVNIVYFIYNAVTLDCLIESKGRLRESIGFIRTLIVSLLPWAVMFVCFLCWELLIRLCKKTKRSERRLGLQGSIFVSLFILHPILLDCMLNIFKCIDVDERSLAFVDPTRECYGSDQLFYIFCFAIPTIVLFCMIFPVYCFYFINKNKEKLDSNEMLLKFGYLYKGIHINFINWEGIKLIRNSLILIILAFSLQKSIKVLLILLIILNFIYLKKNRPTIYNQIESDNLEYFSFITVMVVSVINLYEVNNDDEDVGAFLFIVNILWNCCYFLIWFVTIIRIRKKEVSMKKVKPSKSLKGEQISKFDASINFNFIKI